VKKKFGRAAAAFDASGSETFRLANHSHAATLALSVLSARPARLLPLPFITSGLNDAASAAPPMIAVSFNTLHIETLGLKRDLII
ncbi:hypothetical protein, partial [Pseudomonas syringae group genomosp. 7]|uniref:hypothetical protein n=1 Tax=Pseudomonas syringae group genomosp. 7 TaxID=251699 RepID=UPI0037703C01